MQVTVDKDDLMLLAAHEQYEPSTNDLTKGEMGAEFVAQFLEKHINIVKQKQAMQAAVFTKSTVTAVSDD
jgi:hypothetical protein